MISQLIKRAVPSVNGFGALCVLTLTIVSETGTAVDCSSTSGGVIMVQRQYTYRTATSGCGLGGGGRFECVSNPFRSTSDATMGWVQKTFDNAGRLTEVAHQNGAQTQKVSRATYSYNGFCTTAYDEAATSGANTNNPGSIKQTCSDCNGSRSFPLQFSDCFPSNIVSGLRTIRSALRAVFAFKCPRPCSRASPEKSVNVPAAGHDSLRCV